MGAQTENSELIKRTFGKYLAMSILITLSATLGMMIDNVIAGNLLGSGAVAAIGMSLSVFMLFSVCAPMAPYPSISPSMSAKKKRRFCSVSTMCTGLIWFGALPCMTRISRHNWLVSSCSTRAMAGANVPSSVM